MTARTERPITPHPPNPSPASGRGGAPIQLPSPSQGRGSEGLGGGVSLSLAALLPALQRQPAFDDLRRAVAAARPSDAPARLSVADPAKPYAVAALSSALGRTVVLLTA